jgi:hypothetical protein
MYPRKRIPLRPPRWLESDDANVSFEETFPIDSLFSRPLQPWRILDVANIEFGKKQTVPAKRAGALRIYNLGNLANIGVT